MRFFASLLLLTCIAAGAAPRCSAQEGFLGWVGLHAQDRLGWLENENRIGDLCPATVDQAVCRAEVLAPTVDTFPLYAAAAESSRRVGALLVESAPGRGISAQFQATESEEISPFVPDVYLQDWGYGPYFHQTIVRREGSWFQLPPGPWETAVWIRRGNRGSAPSLLYVHPGDIIELGGRGKYVVAASGDTLALREEQPADLWCREGDPPPLVEDRPVSYARIDLVDAQGHLLIRPKYLKGC